MEIGVYHEFHCRPDQTSSAAFEEALAQIEAADRWGLDAIWLAEIHQQPRRSLLTAPLTVASAIAARTRRIKIGTGAAARRRDCDNRPDQQGKAALWRRTQRQPALLCRLRRALFGKPRALFGDTRDRQAGLDAAEFFL